MAGSTDKKFYQSIWNEREHYCEECGKWLGDEPAWSYFSHILPKSHYNKLRYCKANIDLLCPDCHHRWEFKDRKNMRVYSEDKINKLKDDERNS